MRSRWFGLAKLRRPHGRDAPQARMYDLWMAGGKQIQNTADQVGHASLVIMRTATILRAGLRTEEREEETKAVTEAAKSQPEDNGKKGKDIKPVKP